MGDTVISISFVCPVHLEGVYAIWLLSGAGNAEILCHRAVYIVPIADFLWPALIRNHGMRQRFWTEGTEAAKAMFPRQSKGRKEGRIRGLAAIIMKRMPMDLCKGQESSMISR